LSTASFSDVDAPEENPSSLGAERKSSSTSIPAAPFGTSTRNAVISPGSRLQERGFPPADTWRPATSTMGPVGPCSPGIHLG